jgi:hypothetical protein
MIKSIKEISYKAKKKDQAKTKKAEHNYTKFGSHKLCCHLPKGIKRD